MHRLAWEPMLVGHVRQHYQEQSGPLTKRTTQIVYEDNS